MHIFTSHVNDDIDIAQPSPTRVITPQMAVMEQRASSEFPALPPPPPSFNLGREEPGNSSIHIPEQQHLGQQQRHSFRNSAVWTSMDGTSDDPFAADSNGASLNLSKPSLFLQEYNRIAEKRGMRPLVFEGNVDEEELLTEQDAQPGERRNWFARTFGKAPASASRQSSRQSLSEKTSKHSRNGSDPASQSHGIKKDTTDTLKNENLQTLVRICGKSFLYLPSEYATRSLMLPTCFRAAAQYLVQNGPETRGIFRISGSLRVVNELYDYYCISPDDDEDIAATVRAPNLPFHIKAGVHDVASMFKRLLAGLPGGIIGYLPLFDALVEIHKTLNPSNSANPAFNGTQQRQTRARLIALAMGSTPSQFQRELMCAVFGLLCMIGRSAEMARQQDAEGHQLPNSERMGYCALGIIFGPLLLGDLLESYSTDQSDDLVASSSAAAASPSFPSTPSPRPKADKRRKSMVSDKRPLSMLPLTLDKILLANSVAEMMITYWRDVVHEMKHMGIMRKESLLQQQQQDILKMPGILRPSRSETFTGQNENMTAPQTPQHFGSRLRKTRSASVNRDPSNSAQTKQPSVAFPSQRPADMTFEQFAARKKLKNYASNISIASESTRATSERQQSAGLLPPAEELSAASSPATTRGRPSPAKLTKQRRLSGGLSSLFSDKSASFVKNPPKVAVRDAPTGAGNSVTSLQSGDAATSPWKISLKPVKALNAGVQQVDGNVKITESPAKVTPAKTHQAGNAAYLYQSEPADYMDTSEIPQSKTATLIARIMNSRQQPTPVPPKSAGAGKNNFSRKDKNADVSYGTPDSATFEKSRSSKTPTRHHSGRKNAALTTSLDEHNNRAPPELSTPSSKQPWRTHVASPSVGSPVAKWKGDLGSAHDPIKRAGSSSSRNSSTKGDTQNKTLQTPQRKGSRRRAFRADDDRLGYRGSDYEVSKKFRDGKGAVDTPNAHSPLSEINNNARGLNRTPSKRSSMGAPKSSASKKTRGYHSEMVFNTDRLEAKSPTGGSSVKAMAAMFDSGAWKPSSETPPVGVIPWSTGHHGTPRAHQELSQYTTSPSLSKSADPAASSVSLYNTPQKSAKGGQRDDRPSPSVHIMASERRRLRLTRSEDRSARLGRGVRLTAGEEPEVAQSVDCAEAPAVPGHKYLTPQMRREGILDLETQYKSEQSTAYPTALRPPPKSSCEMTSPSLPSKQIQELQQLLDAKTLECRIWKDRAESAEKRMAELESQMVDVDGTRYSPALFENKDKLHPVVTVIAQDDHEALPQWQHQLPARASVQLLRRNAEIDRAIRELGDIKSAGGSMAMSLRRDSGTEDGNLSESSSTTVVTRGRLTNERLLPFSM